MENVRNYTRERFAISKCYPKMRELGKFYIAKKQRKVRYPAWVRVPSLGKIAMFVYFYPSWVKIHSLGEFIQLVKLTQAGKGEPDQIYPIYAICDKKKRMFRPKFYPKPKKIPEQRSACSVHFPCLRHTAPTLYPHCTHTVPTLYPH